MAALDLVPNPGLVAVQAGIFLANLLVIKKLMIDPYLLLRDRRFAATKGGQDEAEKLLRQADEQSKHIETRLNEAFDYAKTLRANASAEATKTQESAVSRAKDDAKATLERLRTQVSAALAAEQTKVPALVKELTGQLYTTVIH